MCLHQLFEAGVSTKSWVLVDMGLDNALMHMQTFSNGLIASLSLKRQGMDSYWSPLRARVSLTRHAYGLILQSGLSPANSQSFIWAGAMIAQGRPTLVRYIS